MYSLSKEGKKNESHHSAGLSRQPPSGPPTTSHARSWTSSPGPKKPFVLGLPTGSSPDRHVQRAGRHEQGRQAVVQERHHVQHGRVRRPAAGPSGELPLVHVAAPVRPDRHRQGERQYPQRQRPRPRRRVRRLRRAHPQGRRHPPVRRRHRTRWPHRLQRAGLLADLPHPHGAADHRYQDRQLPLLRQRPEQGPRDRPERRRRDRDGQPRKC